MEKDTDRERRREPSPVVEPRDDVRVLGGRRCPFCHDEVSVETSEWVACRACLARHHAACWGEGGRCAACGSRDAITATRPRRGLRIALVSAAVAAMVAGVVAANQRSAAKDAVAAAVVEAHRQHEYTKKEEPNLLSTWGRTPHRWKALPVGSFIEVEQVFSTGSRSVSCITLVEKTDTQATLSEEYSLDGKPVVHCMTIDFGAAWSKYEMDEDRVTTAREKLTGPFGELDCQRLVYEETVNPPEGPGRMHEEVWLAKGIPEPVKCVIQELDHGTTWTWTLLRFVPGKG